MDFFDKENEVIDDLEFKGLKIIQKKSGFKFGIDAVLLSDFAKEIKKNSDVIDIGTGTGIISILLCGKTNLKTITGIEIQKEMYELAVRNSKLNKLEDRFKVIDTNINDIKKYLEYGRYDAVVTNPPYKKLDTGLKNDNINKLISRHEVACNLEDIIEKSSKLLKNNGEFYMIHRTERLVDIIELLRKYRLEPKKIKLVYPYIDKEPNLVLVKAVKNGKPFLIMDKPLIVYKDKNQYTEEILKIYNKI